MKINAACALATDRFSRIRADNYYFDGGFLELNEEAPEGELKEKGSSSGDRVYAVFGGKGEGDAAQTASYLSAAVAAKQYMLTGVDGMFFDNVIRRSGLALEREGGNMYATVSMLTFHPNDTVTVTGMGDGAVYRIRNGRADSLYSGSEEDAVPDLGMAEDPNEVEPFTCEQDVQPGDIYLVCSEPLTRALTPTEIAVYLRDSKNAADALHDLIEAAQNKNTSGDMTAIVMMAGKANWVSAVTDQLKAVPIKAWIIGGSATVVVLLSVILIVFVFGSSGETMDALIQNLNDIQKLQVDEPVSLELSGSYADFNIQIADKKILSFSKGILTGLKKGTTKLTVTNSEGESQTVTITVIDNSEDTTTKEKETTKKETVKPSTSTTTTAQKETTKKQETTQIQETTTTPKQTQAVTTTAPVTEAVTTTADTTVPKEPTEDTTTEVPTTIPAEDSASDNAVTS